MSGDSENGVEQPDDVRVSRRRFIEGGSAAVGGLVVTPYIKPALLSLGVPNTQAAISGSPLQSPLQSPLPPALPPKGIPGGQ